MRSSTPLARQIPISQPDHRDTPRRIANQALDGKALWLWRTGQEALMIHFPVFEHLNVTGYRVFPGTADRPGLDFPTQRGISIIAGVNGLGKTTLVSMLFRLVVGPFELPKLGATGGNG